MIKNIRIFQSGFPQKQTIRKGFELINVIWELSTRNTGRGMRESDWRGKMDNAGCLT